MANGWPTFSVVARGEFARAGGVEAERDDRLAGALVEARLRVGEIAARHQDLLLDDIGLLRRLRAQQQVGIRRHVAARAPDRPTPMLSTMRKSSLAVLPSSSFSRVGSCRPGTWTRMRSTPWRWISGSTVPSSLTRRSTIWIDCSTDCRIRSVIAACGHGQPDQPAAGVGDLEAALAAGAHQAAERLRQLAQLGQRGRPGRCRVLIRTSTASAAHGEPGIGDLGLAQHAADVVANLVELVLLDRVGIDLEQDVRAALQIEAEHQMALRPFRPGLDGGFREEVRNRAQADHQRRQNDRQRLPPCEIQHRVDLSESRECRRASGAPDAFTWWPNRPWPRRRHWPGRRPWPWRPWPAWSCRSSRHVLDRLALGADAGDHLAHLAGADAVGDLELDGVVVDHLGDLADQAARGDDGVAAADVLHQSRRAPSPSSAAGAGSGNT